MAEPLLEARQLSVRRGNRVVLEGVDLALPAGRMLGVLGPNGAGKSTLLKAAAGLLPHGGVLRLEGRDAAALGRRDRARLAAYVPQHSELDAALDVRDVVAQGRFAHQGGHQAAIARAMRLTDSERLAGRPFSSLSYGERRLVLLARALATEARLLLLDEPTAALDVRHALELMALLRRLAAEGAAVVVVLHQLVEAAGSCDDALLLAEGRPFASGPIAEVVASEPVRRVYGVELVPGAAFGYRLPGEPR
jgi:iron complex transport system ATP-binding protein